MLDVKAVYDKELAECEASFAKVDWKSEAMASAPRVCPNCESRLIYQKNAKNTVHENTDSTCRQCGEEIKAYQVIETALKTFFEGDNYAAYKDGGEPSLDRCPECSYETYVMTADENACAWCQA
jgi:hypothetical protein